jgi:hypothetical protein
MSKLYSAVAGVLLATFIAAAAYADGPNISAQRLLDSWRDDDPGMRMVAEVIASGFSGGGDSAGKRRYCAAPSNHERL